MVTIKEEFKNKRVAFGKSANPLYKRSEAELIELAIIGLESGDKSIISLFEEKGFPSLFALKKARTDSQLKPIVAAVVKQNAERDTSLHDKNSETRNFKSNVSSDIKGNSKSFVPASSKDSKPKN